MKAPKGTVRAWIAAASLSMAVAVMPGCGDDDDGGGGNNPDPTPTATVVPEAGIEDFVSDLRVSGRDDRVAVRMPGDPPAESGGPLIMAPTAATVDPGITVGPVLIFSDEVFSTLLLEIPGSSGYWVLDFGSIGGGAGTGTNLNVDVTFGPNPPAAAFDCLFSGSEGGAVGPEVVTSITVEECTVEEFCDGVWEPVDALPCFEYCELPLEQASCILEASVTVVCGAGFACEESVDCAAAGQCVEEVSAGAISAGCAEDFCELLESVGSEF